LTDTLYIHICVKHFGMTNIKKLKIMQLFKMTARSYTAESAQSWCWGAWRCTSTSYLVSSMTRLEHHQTTVVSFREYGEKQIPSNIISPATRRYSS